MPHLAIAILVLALLPFNCSLWETESSPCITNSYKLTTLNHSQSSE
jgi:hypothetical protein